MYRYRVMTRTEEERELVLEMLLDWTLCALALVLSTNVFPFSSRDQMYKALPSLTQPV